MDKKSERMIDMYVKLINGEILNKRLEARRHNVSEKSIQRDIDDLRDYIFKKHGISEVELIYDRKENGYRLIGPDGNPPDIRIMDDLKNQENL